MSDLRNPVSPVASRVIAKCGGAKSVSGITGHSISSVYKWTYAKADGGTGGLIPSRAQELIWEAAMRGEVELQASDFFVGQGDASPDM